MAPKLDGFDFKEPLGKGSFGEVWLAFDRVLKVDRAVKILRPHPFTDAQAERCLAEGRLMASLAKHPNRVEIYAAKNLQIGVFLIMQFVAGGSFGRKVSVNSPLPYSRAVRYVAQAAAGLNDLHANGIFHCDIKPANIFLNVATDEAVLGDYGVATKALTSVGYGFTPEYASPELLCGEKPSVRSDVYALAATLFHLIVGCPFQDSDGNQVAFSGPPIPHEVHAVLDQGLTSDAGLRPDLENFQHLLREALWKPLADRLPNVVMPRQDVSLKVEVAVARAAKPALFQTLQLADLRPPHVATTDHVRINVTANAAGYLTVLRLGQNTSPDVVFPQHNAVSNAMAPGQNWRFDLVLTPPGGTDRILFIWNRRRRFATPTEWWEWLIQAGHESPQGSDGDFRSIELVRVSPDALPRGDVAFVEVPLTHA